MTTYVCPKCGNKITVHINLAHPPECRRTTACRASGSTRMNPK